MYVFEPFIIVGNCTGTSSFFLDSMKYHSSCIGLALYSGHDLRQSKSGHVLVMQYCDARNKICQRQGTESSRADYSHPIMERWRLRIRDDDGSELVSWILIIRRSFGERYIAHRRLVHVNLSSPV